MRIAILYFAVLVGLSAAEPYFFDGPAFGLPHRTRESGAATTIQPSSVSFSTSTASMLEFEMLPHALKQFIIDMSPKEHLEERQNAAPGGGAAPAALQPTQLSPTTVYDIGKGATTYVQSFASTPDPFPQPTPGSIGLGQIQGQVGKMRTYDNPAPTNRIDSRVLIAVAGGIGAGIIF